MPWQMVSLCTMVMTTSFHTTFQSPMRLCLIRGGIMVLTTSSIHTICQSPMQLCLMLRLWTPATIDEWGSRWGQMKRSVRFALR